MRKIFKKADIVFICILSLSIAFVSGIIYFNAPSDSSNIVVELDGEIFGIFPLDEYAIIDINGKNTLEITEDGAKMIEATCPDKLCLNYSPIENNLGVIVCLPHEVLVYSDGENKESQIDVVAQ